VDFLRARTEEQIISRQEEIINACDILFGKYGYEGVNFNAISKMTSFKRPTIYLYYKTKDEVLLDLLKKEMLHWNAAMEAALNVAEPLTKERYCEIFASTLAPHDKMLKLLAILNTNIEKQCGVEKLREFKREVNCVFVTIWESLNRHFPHANEEKKSFFLIAFMANILGLYPLAHLSQRQIDAMLLAGTRYTPFDFKDAYCRILLLLVSDF
jgi:AcrR family transcriptional regulator